MVKYSKKKKQADFQKVKLKVGKTLKKANATVIDLKSKVLVLPGQESLLRSTIPEELKYKESLKNHISHLKHASANIRKRSLSGILDEINLHPDLLTYCLEHIESLLQRTMDEEPQVRKLLLKVLEKLFKTIEKVKFEPFLPRMFIYASSCMTHLLTDIRIDSLKFLSLYFDSFGFKFLTSSNSLLLDHFLGLFSFDVTSIQSQLSTTNQFNIFTFKHLLLTTFSKYLELLHSKETLVSTVSSSLSSSSSSSSASSSSFSTFFIPFPSPSHLLSESQLSSSSSSSASSSSAILTQTKLYSPIKLVTLLSSSILHTWIETSQSIFTKSQISFTSPLEICYACVKSLYFAWALNSSLPDDEVLKNYKQSTLRHFLVYFPFGQKLQMDEKTGLILLSTNLYMAQLLHQLYPTELDLILPFYTSLFDKKTKLAIIADQLDLIRSSLETCFYQAHGFLNRFLNWIQGLNPNRPVKTVALRFFISFLKKPDSSHIVTKELLQLFCFDLINSFCALNSNFTTFSLIQDGFSFLKFVFCSYKLDPQWIHDFTLKLGSFFSSSQSNDLFLALPKQIQIQIIHFLYYVNIHSFTHLSEVLSVCLKSTSLSLEIRSQAETVLGL